MNGTEKPAVLITHGFTGSQHELEGLQTHLQTKGFNTSLPLLPGHGTFPNDLLIHGSNSWLEKLKAEYAQLKQRHNHVAIIGLSFGGSLAIKLAAEVSPSALVTIGAPVRLSYHWAMRIVLPILQLFGPDLVKPERGFFANEQIPGYEQTCYNRVPIKAFLEMMSFLKREMNATTFEKIQAPTLIIQGTSDPIITSRSAETIYSGIHSATKKIIHWQDPFHLIVQGQRKQELYALITDWLMQSSR